MAFREPKSSAACCEPRRDMNFKVNKSLHRRFKTVAAMQDIEMRELLERAFEEYVKRHRLKFPDDV